jgi:Skp family chaperone for outer membrane proteins
LHGTDGGVRLAPYTRERRRGVMRPPAVIAFVAAAILIGFGIAYFWQSRQVSTLQAELGDLKSKMGMEIQNLQNEVKRLTSALAEAEGRLKEEQAARKGLEELLQKARVLK